MPTSKRRGTKRRGGAASSGGTAAASGTPIRVQVAVRDPDEPLVADPAMEAELESRHLEDIVLSFMQYSQRAHAELSTTAGRLARLPPAHRERVAFLDAALVDARRAIQANAAFIDALLSAQQLYDGYEALAEWADEHPGALGARVSHDNASKVESTLKQFVRDWSDDGAAERAQCYSPVIEAIRARFASPFREDSAGTSDGDERERERVRVIVPGSGLGRLAFELACLGYDAQGNEFSYHMLLASQFVLNAMPDARGHTIYPYATSRSNHRTRADQTRPVVVPDVSPFSIPPGSQFSMTAGDFLEVYADEVASVDVFATVFFIDTARNVLAYIDLIARALRPGGVWVNLGPLLYHFADMHEFMSLELAWDELRAVIQAAGFRLEDERVIDCSYAANQRSMLTSAYHAQFFVAVKLP